MNPMHNTSASPAAAPRDWSNPAAPGHADFADGDFSIDFAAIRGIIWRQRFTLAVIIAAALVIGFVITLLTTPIYMATATVKLDPKPTEIINGQETISLRTNEIRPYKETLGQIMQSRSMAERVATSNPKLVARLAPPDSEKPSALAASAWQKQKLNVAIAKLRGGLLVDTQSDLNIMAISFSSPDAVLAKDAANAYVEALLTDDIKRSLDQSEYSRQYLVDQIRQLQAKLANSERQSIAYARSARIVSAGMLGGGAPAPAPAGGAAPAVTAAPQTVTGSNLSAINQAYAEARNQRIAAEQRWKAASGVPVGSLKEVQDNSTIQSLIGERGKAAATLADLRTRYGEDYPQAREVRAQIAALDRQIQQLSNEVKLSIQTAYQAAVNQENALAAEVAKVSDQTLDEQSRRVQFGQLERETAAYRNQLDTMLARYNELAASANIKPSTITKLDAAETPFRPTSPDMAKNLLIALVLGVGLAAAVAILVEVFDDRLRSISDLERKLRLPTLGITPLVATSDDLTESSAIDEAYSSARIALEFALPQRDHAIVAFTSSQVAEGKSTTAFMISKKLATHGRKVLLIDADLRKPSLANMVGASRGAAGLTEVLLGSLPLESALVPVEGSDLMVLPSGSSPAQPVEILSSPLFAQFLERCAQEYSLVVIDSPPVMGLADAPIISRLADATVFIIEANRAHFGQAKAALRRLRDAGSNVVGAVLTKFVSLSAGQSYDYQYSYYTYGNKE